MGCAAVAESSSMIGAVVASPGFRRASALLEIEAPFDPAEAVIDAVGAERRVGVVGHFGGSDAADGDFQRGQALPWSRRVSIT